MPDIIELQAKLDEATTARKEMEDVVASAMLRIAKLDEAIFYYRDEIARIETPKAEPGKAPTFEECQTAIANAKIGISKEG